MASDVQQGRQSISRPPTAAGDVPDERRQSLERPRMEVEPNSNTMEQQKPATVADNIASFHAANNDDSAIDLDDDSMLMSVGKYGDMMASDPADAEGDVIVI